MLVHLNVDVSMLLLVLTEVLVTFFLLSLFETTVFIISFSWLFSYSWDYSIYITMFNRFFFEKLRSNSHTIKFHPLKFYNFVTFSMFRRFCKHYHHLILEYFITPKILQCGTSSHSWRSSLCYSSYFITTWSSSYLMSYDEYIDAGDFSLGLLFFKPTLLSYFN